MTEPHDPKPAASPGLWDQGPVEQPADLPVEVDGADVVELVPEVEAEEIVEILEVEDPLLSVLEETPPSDAEAVVPLESILAVPPAARPLAPPLPPPPPTTEDVQPGIGAAGEPEPVGPPSSFIAGEHRVVLHTVDGQVLRGTLADSDLRDPELRLRQPDGSGTRVPSESVKAVFFMLPSGERPPLARGVRVRVDFGEGRQVSGLSPDYAPDAHGFFVLPTDARTQTARVWVYRGAARQVTSG